MRWYWGLAALVGGVAAGASIGALMKPDGPSGQPDARWGAAAGGAAGLLLVGVAGLGAAVSESTRAAGLTAAIPVAGLLAATAITQAAR